jgi:DNA-binding beta-propeller fold protein YncE
MIKRLNLWWISICWVFVIFFCPAAFCQEGGYHVIGSVEWRQDNDVGLSPYESVRLIPYQNLSVYIFDDVDDVPRWINKGIIATIPGNPDSPVMGKIREELLPGEISKGDLLVEIPDDNHPPRIVGLTYPSYDLVPGRPIALIAEVTDDENDHLSYHWKGDFGTAVTHLPVSYWTPQTAGEYQVYLAVTDAKNECNKTFSLSIKTPGEQVAYVHHQSTNYPFYSVSDYKFVHGECDPYGTLFLQNESSEVLTLKDYSGQLFDFPEDIVPDRIIDICYGGDALYLLTRSHGVLQVLLSPPYKYSAPRVTTRYGAMGKRLGEFEQPVNLAVTTNGNVLVLDQTRGTVSVFGPRGDFIFAFGRYGEAEGEFSKPISIETDHMDNIYVLDQGHGILRFSNDYRFERTLRFPEPSSSTAFRVDNRSQSILVLNSERMKMDRYSLSSLISLDTHDIGRAFSNRPEFNLRTVDGFCVRPDKGLFLFSAPSRVVIDFCAENDSVRGFFTSQRDLKPWGISAYPENQFALMALMPNNDRVVLIQDHLGWIRDIITERQLNISLRDVIKLLTSEFGEFFLVTKNAVIVYDPLIGRGSQYPVSGINGNIINAALVNEKCYLLQRDGISVQDDRGIIKSLVHWGKQHRREPSRPSRPTQFAIDKDGSIYLFDARNNEILLYSSDGKYERRIPLTQNFGSGFPTEMTFTPDNVLAALDGRNAAVYFFDKSGRFLQRLALRENSRYIDLASDSLNRLYVLEENTGVVDIYCRR